MLAIGTSLSKSPTLPRTVQFFAAQWVCASVPAAGTRDESALHLSAVFFSVQKGLESHSFKETGATASSDCHYLMLWKWRKHDEWFGEADVVLFFLNHVSLSTSKNTAALTLNYLGYSTENLSCVFLMNVPEEKRIPKLSAPILTEIQELLF